MTDREYMLEALALARMGWGLTTPNPMVGAVIVKDGEIIGRGYHVRAGEHHAEINALIDAEKHHYDVRGATIYVTLEPCSSYGRTPPCSEALVKAGIKRVVIGALDPNPAHGEGSVVQFQKLGIDVTVGVERQLCTQLNEPFFKWITTGKPFVILKMAMTLDGKIATADGDSKWITGTEARQRVQQLRRLSDAILVGGETVRLDHPALTVRDPENWPCQPLRLVASCSMDEEELAEYFPDGAERVEFHDEYNWNEFLDDLGKRNIVTLLIEGGGELAGSAIAAEAVDYIEFHIAPKLLGGRDSRPVLGGESPEAMALAKSLHRVKITQYGRDIAISGYLAGKEDECLPG